MKASYSCIFMDTSLLRNCSLDSLESVLYNKEQIDSGLLFGDDLTDAQEIYNKWNDAYNNISTPDMMHTR